MEKIAFQPEGEEPVQFYVLEQTRIGGVSYILVTDKEKGDGEAFILKDTSAPEAPEAVYEFVEDETELGAVASVFEDLLEDIELSEND